MSVMEAARTSETSVDNHFTRQYIPEDNSEQPNSSFQDGTNATSRKEVGFEDQPNRDDEKVGERWWGKVMRRRNQGVHVC
jgi:hypothetical protein